MKRMVCMLLILQGLALGQSIGQSGFKSQAASVDEVFSDGSELQLNVGHGLNGVTFLFYQMTFSGGGAISGEGNIPASTFIVSSDGRGALVVDLSQVPGFVALDQLGNVTPGPVINLSWMPNGQVQINTTGTYRQLSFGKLVVGQHFQQRFYSANLNGTFGDLTVSGNVGSTDTGMIRTR